MNNPEVVFKANGHKERFLAILREIGSFGRTQLDAQISAEYGSALYLLTSTPAIWGEVESRISGSGIPFDQILAEGRFSSTETTLIRLAANLFGFGGIDVDMLTLCNYGNEVDFAVVLSALRLRRSRLKFSDFE